MDWVGVQYNSLTNISQRPLFLNGKETWQQESGHCPPDSLRQTKNTPYQMVWEGAVA